MMGMGELAIAYNEKTQDIILGTRILGVFCPMLMLNGFDSLREYITDLVDFYEMKSGKNFVSYKTEIPEVFLKAFEDKPNDSNS